MPTAGPRLLFKGGTSLSKAFGLISRFSEDIDVTVFRDDLGESGSVEALEQLSGKKRKAKLDAIKAACQAFIAGTLQSQLLALFGETIKRAKIPASGPGIVLDPEDADRQSLLLWYPSVTMPAGNYIRPAVKIESGAKSALEPHHSTTVRPYVSEDVPGLDLAVGNVVTVDAERTFWDKVVILHGLRRWFDRRGVLRGGGQRVSRHYYDLHRLLESDAGKAALADLGLGRDCVRHARMFFNSTDLDLATADPGSFALVPSDVMLRELRRDYQAMSGMVFGQAPAFDDVMASVTALDTQVNRPLR